MNIRSLRSRYGLSAGYRYSSGKLHAAWDIPAPLLTPLHIDVPATVRDLNDGAPNNRPGHNPGSGAPSNWILLHVPYAGGTASLLLNHFSPGLAVRKGQHLAAGALLGKTGNSGNSSGPHLHCAAFKGAWSGGDRYRYLNDTGLIIWEPDRVLVAPAPAPTPEQEDDDMVVIFINHKGKRYAAYPASGIRRPIASPTQEKDIRYITEKAGGRVVEWSKGKDVADPDAFGKVIG